MLSTNHAESPVQLSTDKDQLPVENQALEKIATTAGSTENTLETPLPASAASSAHSTPQGSRSGRHRSKRAPGSSMPASEATSNAAAPVIDTAPATGLLPESESEAVVAMTRQSTYNTQDVSKKPEVASVIEAESQAMTDAEPEPQDKAPAESSGSVTPRSATDLRVENPLSSSPKTEDAEANVADQNAYSSANEASKRFTKLMRSLRDTSAGFVTKIKRLTSKVSVPSMEQYRPSLFDLFEMKQWSWQLPPLEQVVFEKIPQYLSVAVLILGTLSLMQFLWWATEQHWLRPASAIDFFFPAPNFEANVASIPFYDDEFATSTRYSATGNTTYAEYRLNTTRSLRQAQDRANRAMNLSHAVSDHCFAMSNAQTLFNAFAQTLDSPPCQEGRSFSEAISELMKAVLPASLDKLLNGRSSSETEHTFSSCRSQQQSAPERDNVDLWMDTMTKLFADPVGPLDRLDTKPSAQMAIFLNDLSVFSQRHAERIARAERELHRITVREAPIRGLMSYLTYNKGPRLERWAARSRWEVLSQMYRETRIDVLALALQVPPLSHVLGRESQAVLAVLFKDGQQLRNHLLSARTAAEKQQPLMGEAREQWALAFRMNRYFLSSADLKWAFKKQLRQRVFAHLWVAITYAYDRIMFILHPVTSNPSTTEMAYEIRNLTANKLARATRHRQSVFDRQSQLDSIVGLVRATRRCELVLPRLQHALLDLWASIPEPESDATGPLGPLPALFSPDELLHVYGFADLSQTGLGTVGFREAALGFDGADGKPMEDGEMRVAGWPWAADVRDVPLLRSLAAFEGSVTGWEAGIGLARARKG